MDPEEQEDMQFGLYTLGHVQRLTEFSADKIKDLIQRGEIEAVQVGSKVFVRRQSLKDWLSTLPQASILKSRVAEGIEVRDRKYRESLHKPNTPDLLLGDGGIVKYPGQAPAPGNAQASKTPDTAPSNAPKVSAQRRVLPKPAIVLPRRIRRV